MYIYIERERYTRMYTHITDTAPQGPASCSKVKAPKFGSRVNPPDSRCLTDVKRTQHVQAPRV